MFDILEARDLAPDIRYLKVAAPRVARRHSAGQFVIVRVSATGERIPLTVAEADPVGGWIAVIVQGVGATTRRLNRLDTGDVVHDVAGPLGMPSRVDPVGNVVVVGGGVGTAIAYPVAVAHHRAGNRVVAIVGGRSRSQVLLERDLGAVCAEVIPVTDDGSHGHRGMVTDVLTDLIAAGRPIDLVVAAGPVAMMQAVAEVTHPHGIPTVVSLNPIMVDGTGMCGGCRVVVGGKVRFACVDGPEFDAHEVDFELLSRRNRAYREFEESRVSAPSGGAA